MESELESGTMTEGGGEISQSEMQSDFLSDYQLVDETTGEAIEEKTELEAPVVPEAKTPELPKAETPGTQTTVTDYTKELYNDDGTLNVEKAMSLFGAKQEPIVPAQQPVIPPVQQQQQPPKQPEVPVDPMTQMRKNAMAAIELQRYYMEQGYDANQAMAQAEKDIDDHLRQHLLKSEMQKMREEMEVERKSLREEIKNERELAKAEPLAETNLFNVLNRHAKGMSVNTLRQAIFDKNLGGNFLVDMFEMMNPDKLSLQGDPLKKAMNDWFIKVSAKNERFLESLAINAVNNIKQRVYPEMAKMIQQNAVARQGVKKATQPGPRTPQNPAVHGSSEKSKAQAELDIFLGNSPRPDARPHI